MNAWEARHTTKPMPYAEKRKRAHAGRYYLAPRYMNDLEFHGDYVEAQQLIAAVDAHGEWLH